MATYPKNLLESLRRGSVVPFVGAGVSMAVRIRSGGGSASAYPGWIELLHRAEGRLADEGKATESDLVRILLQLNPPRLLEAAGEAQRYLGATWYRFLKEQFDPDRSLIDEPSLGLARAVWTLGSPLIITTNYDRALRWSCPEPGNLREWSIEAPAGLVELVRGELSQPTIWHLHGTIDDTARMILTPDGYSELYPRENDAETRYRTALNTLRLQLASRTLLFVGLSFDDALFGDQLRWIHAAFKDMTGPHYVLVRKAEASTMAARVANMPVEILIFEDFGEPLVSYLTQLAAQRDSRGGSSEPGAATSFPTRTLVDTAGRALVNGNAPVAPPHAAPPPDKRGSTKRDSDEHKEGGNRGPRSHTHGPGTGPQEQPITWLFVYPRASNASAIIENSMRATSVRHAPHSTILSPVSGLPGHAIADDVFSQVDNARIVVADITQLNFDIAMIIGYATGKSKRIALIMNSDGQPTRNSVRAGIFESFAAFYYSDSEQLLAQSSAIEKVEPMRFPQVAIDRRAPVYVVDTAFRTEGSIRAIARIKKARIMFRSFDPSEQARLLPIDVFRGVAASIGVVALLQKAGTMDAEITNLRAAFAVGLALALNRRLLVLQEGDEPISPAAVDFVSIYNNPTDIDRHINDLAPMVIEALQASTESDTRPLTGFLAELDLGASAAENEIAKLSNYYLTTDHYQKVLDGSARLVVGRKGSGKTALFFQVRNKLRADKKKIVLDLKPEGHQLKRFKEFVLEFLGEAIQEHVATAFWEYVLLLEICRKLLDKDQQAHLKDHTLYAPYRRLHELYQDDEFIREGDFSERMLALVQRITTEFREQHHEPGGNLSVRDVINLVYKHDMPALRSELVAYLKLKRGVWILFDNIDKGWPTRGVGRADIVILRGLLDATRDIEKLFRRHGIDVQTVVFVRNDVFELLVDQTPDRGKESRESIDWTDVDLLKELLRRRFLYNGVDAKSKFDEAWRRICVSHIDGEDSAEYLISRSMMRPRNLLNLVSYCRSNAVNLRRQRIERDDVKKAVAQYSADIGNEIGLEIRDVFPTAEDILYHFIGCEPSLTLKELRDKLMAASVPPGDCSQMIDILLWFSFLGVIVPGEADFEEIYSYSVFYDMKKLKRHTGDLADDSAQFVIHRAFWPFLDIAE